MFVELLSKPLRKNREQHVWFDFFKRSRFLLRRDRRWDILAISSFCCRIEIEILIMYVHSAVPKVQTVLFFHTCVCSPLLVLSMFFLRWLLTNPQTRWCFPRWQHFVIVSCLCASLLVLLSNFLHWTILILSIFGGFSFFCCNIKWLYRYASIPTNTLISLTKELNPSNTFQMQVPKLYFHIAVVWNYLIRILLPLDFGLIIWFGVNLLQLASSSTNFESYVDVFVPLYVAEACGGILLIIMAIFLVRTCHLENDLWVKDCFQYVVDVRARSASISILSLFHVSIMLLESQEYHSYRSLMPQENHSKSNARMRTRLWRELEQQRQHRYAMALVPSILQNFPSWSVCLRCGFSRLHGWFVFPCFRYYFSQAWWWCECWRDERYTESSFYRSDCLRKYCVVNRLCY